MKDRLWRCKDGRILPVAQMDTRHIQNSIARIQRLNWRRGYLPRLELELEIRKIKE
jgi:hypothetical protein